MKDRILILGKGFIGVRLRRAFDCNISDRKLRSFDDVNDEINKYRPEVIINCIGHVGGNVDDCEQDKDKTLMANTFLPILLAEVSLRKKIKLVHISSGCIYHFDYDKDRPISEDKTPDFFNLFYSRSKIYSERALEILSKEFNILIVRPRIPLDNRPHPKNILTKLIGYKKVIELPNSITYFPDFIRALKHLIRINARGIYNVVNSGALRYPELMEVYKKYVPSFEYKIIPFKQLGITRTNLILSTQKLKKAGFKIRDIHEVLEECVKGYIKY